MIDICTTTTQTPQLGSEQASYDEGDDLQLEDSSATPTQNFPSKFGAGLVQVRIRV